MTPFDCFQLKTPNRKSPTPPDSPYHILISNKNNTPTQNPPNLPSAIPHQTGKKKKPSQPGAVSPLFKDSITPAPPLYIHNPASYNTRPRHRCRCIKESKPESRRSLNLAFSHARFFRASRTTYTLPSRGRGPCISPGSALIRAISSARHHTDARRETATHVAPLLFSRLRCCWGCFRLVCPAERWGLSLVLRASRRPRRRCRRRSFIGGAVTESRSWSRGLERVRVIRVTVIYSPGV